MCGIRTVLLFSEPITGREAFVDGLRPGAQIMLAVFCGDDGELKPLV